MQTVVKVSVDKKEILDAIIYLAREQTGIPEGSAKVELVYTPAVPSPNNPESGKPLYHDRGELLIGATVEFQYNGKKK